MLFENVIISGEISEYKSKIFAHMEIGGAFVKMQVDSGASSNILPRKYLPKGKVIKKAEVKLITRCKSNFKVLGVAKVQVWNPKVQKKYWVRLVVIDEDYTLLLGSTLPQKMDLITIKRNKILNVNEILFTTYYLGLIMKEITANYSDVFEGLGCLGETLQPEVDQKIAPRRMPLTLNERVKG